MSWVSRERRTCLACGHRGFDTVLDLGELHLSAFPLPNEADPVKSRLRVVHCRNCSLLQLPDVVNPELMYRTYWYRSGTNQTMRDALRDVARSIEARIPLRSGDAVVDIGSNDNTLLSSYQVPGLRRFGFEPSNIGREAQEQHPDIHVINDFFRAVDDLRGQVRAVTSIAMFYDIEDPATFIGDVKSLLAPDGMWVLQLAYLPSMLERNAFDGICHEHLAYYSLHSLERLLEANGMHAFDAEPIELNEGSIRVYARAEQLPPSEGLRAMRAQEDKLGLGTIAPYKAFGERVHGLRGKVRSLLLDAKASGKTVHGYGASTKGNTLLQYFGIDRSLVSAIWERQPQKWGRETAGTRISIISEEEGRAASPDYLLMLPWHFAHEFIARESSYLESGGQFIVPLPTFRVERRAT